MRAINLQGLREQLSAVTTSASTIGDASLVRVTHVSNAGSMVLFVADRNGANTASTTLLGGESIYLQKEPSDMIWAADTSAFATRVVFVY